MSAQPEATDTLAAPSHSMLHRAQYNVKAFGATGDGVTNDTAAIQAAIDAAVAATRGVVYFPPGLYVCASGLSWNHNDISLAGAGIGSSVIWFTGSGTGITVGDGSTVRNVVGFRDLTIRGQQTQPATGLWLRICWQVNLTNVAFVDFATDHLKVDNGGHIRIVGCQDSHNVSFNNTFFRVSNAVDSVITGCTFEAGGGTATCMVLNGANKQIAVSSCTQRGGPIGTFITVGGTGTEDISIVGCSAQEMSEYGINGSSGGTGLTVIGNTLQGNSGTQTGIIVGNWTRPVVIGNVIKGWADTPIQITAMVDGLILGNNITTTSRPIYDGSGATTGLVDYNTWNAGTPTRTSTSVRWGINNKGDDVNLYRSSADTLKTDDALTVTGYLDAVAGLQVNGNLAISNTRNVFANAIWDTSATQSAIDIPAGAGEIRAKVPLRQMTAGDYHEFLENGTTDATAGATNTGRLYVRDNGAGKTQLCVRFATGAVQVIATEP